MSSSVSSKSGINHLLNNLGNETEVGDRSVRSWVIWIQCTHRKGDVLLLLPAATQIEACASLSWSRAYGSCLRPVKTRLRQYSVLAGLPKSATALLYNAYKTQLCVLYLGFERVTKWPRPCINCTGYNLPVHQRIQHHGICPLYLADTVFVIADNPTRLGLRSADSTWYRLPRHVVYVAAIQIYCLAYLLYLHNLRSQTSRRLTYHQPDRHLPALNDLGGRTYISLFDA